MNNLERKTLFVCFCFYVHSLFMCIISLSSIQPLIPQGRPRCTLYIYIRVEWFFYFQMGAQIVVPNYLRSPNPKYDPLKLRFSICANRLKVWLFSSYILRIWISRRQSRQSPHPYLQPGPAPEFRKNRNPTGRCATSLTIFLTLLDDPASPAPGWSRAGGDRLVPPPPTGQIQSRPSKPAFYSEN